MGGVIDVHTHAFPDSLAPRAVAHLKEQGDARAHLNGTVSDLLTSMDRAGIAASVVCSVATEARQVAPILAWSRQIAGDRLIPFPSVFPRAASALADMDMVAAEGFRGIKLHPEYQDFAIDDPVLSDLYSAADAAGLIILFHAGYDIGFPDSDRSSPARIAAVKRAFPSLRIIASHLGGFRQWEEVLRTLSGTDVYLDTSYVFGRIPPGLLGEILEAHRPDRLLFGSDSPWADQSESIREVRKLGLEPEQEQALLFTNAAALLGL
jgi:predicted TIM-barrel fold metal-dependent hydrolase